jgi:hypothetical protein
LNAYNEYSWNCLPSKCVCNFGSVRGSVMWEDSGYVSVSYVIVARNSELHFEIAKYCVAIFRSA